jgi:hypothetical protein
MKHRYGAITTATLAALVLGTAPAMAQISKGLDVNVGAGANVGTGKSDVNTSSPTNQATTPSPSSSSGAAAQPNSGGSTYNSNASGGVSGDAGVSTTDAIAGAKKSNQDVTNPSSSDSVSGSLSGSGSASGSVKSDESASGRLKSDESPSASPSMGDDKAISNQDDRDRMKQQEQMDKKTGLDRAEIK